MGNILRCPGGPREVRPGTREPGALAKDEFSSQNETGLSTRGARSVTNRWGPFVNLFRPPLAAALAATACLAFSLVGAAPATAAPTAMVPATAGATTSATGALTGSAAMRTTTRSAATNSTALVTTSTSSSVETAAVASYPTPQATILPVALTPDANGDMWYPEPSGIARVDPAGRITEFPANGNQLVESAVLTDSSGDAWYLGSQTLPTTETFLNEVTPSGAISDIPLPATGSPTAIEVGPNGDVWIALGQFGDQGQQESGIILMVTPAGAITQYPIPSFAYNATFTPDGTLWFTDQSHIGWITPGEAAGAPDEIAAPVAGNVMGGILVGPDGNVWFAEQSGIGEISSAHVVTSYPLPPTDSGVQPNSLITGSDGDIWFSESRYSGPHAAIGRVTMDGQISTFGLGVTSTYSDIGALSLGSDGNLWGEVQAGTPTVSVVNDIVRVTPQGVATDFPVGSANVDFTTAPDGTLWYSSTTTTDVQIGTISPAGSLEPMTTIPLRPVAETDGPGSLPLSFDTSGDAWLNNSTSSTVDELRPVTSTRVAGADRYATAVQIAEQEFPGQAPVVYVASGANYPDALSAGPAAAKAGGPLLLTAPTSLPSEVSTEIKTLDPGKIVIVGGTGAVSQTVQSQLDAIAPTTRIAGSDRYGTSEALVRASFPSATTVYLATGSDFPDALSAGGAAGSQGDPLLLIDGAESRVDAPTAALLHELGVQKIVVVGGTGAVSADLASSLGAIAPVTRLSGADRYATAEAVDENAYPSASNALIATGLNFPDALAASAWAASTKAPLFLAPGTCIPAQTLTDIAGSGTGTVTIVGGTGALSSGAQALDPCTD